MQSVRRRSVALAGAVVGAVVVGMLSGCVGGDPKPTPTPTPKATPLYSSDEEALAAAKEAYARYVEVSNEVAHDGWADLTPLKEVATGDALKADTKTGESSHRRGYHAEGDATGSVESIERVDRSSITAYTCVDVSSTRVIDTAGIDRTSADRPEIVPFEVRFVAAKGRLVVGRNDRWSGESFCS